MLNNEERLLSVEELMARKKKRTARLKRESKRVISPRDMQMMKKKYDFWKTMHPKENNCQHCVFNGHDCTLANKHYDCILNEGYYCLAFLQEGNYVK